MLSSSGRNVDETVVVFMLGRSELSFNLASISGEPIGIHSFSAGFFLTCSATQNAQF